MCAKKERKDDFVREENNEVAGADIGGKRKLSGMVVACG